MSPRKRFRKSPTAQNAPSGPAVPSVAAGPRAASQASNASADTTVMAGSPAHSVAHSVPENSSITSRDGKDGKDSKDGYASRYASFRESKNKTRSWYGSWPRPPKSEASTQLAKETILGGTTRPSSAADFSRFDTRRADDVSDGASDIVTLPRKQARRPPLSQLTAGLEQQQQQEQQERRRQQQQQQQQQQAAAQSSKEPAALTKAGDQPQPEARSTTKTTSAPSAPPTEPAEEPEATTAPPPDTTNSNEAATAPAAGWFSWLGRSEPVATPNSAAPEVAMAADAEASPGEQEQGDGTQQAAGESSAAQPAPSGGMWTYFWSSTANEAEDKNKGVANEPKDVVMDAPSAPIPVPDAASGAGDSAPATASAGSTWAFWSRDARPKSLGKSGPPESPEEGEIAVIGERSEAHPKPALGVEVKEAPSRKASVKEPPAKDAGSKKNKKLRLESTDTEDSTPGTPTTTKPDAKANAKAEAKAEAKADSKTEPPSKGEASSAKQSAAKQARAALAKVASPNMLLPSFASTYSFKENPSILRQIAHLLLRTQQAPEKHAFRTKDVPKFKKAVAIGVHGLFPAAYLRPMIGQPTGTSIRFANHCAEAVRRWADSHGCEDCEIEKIALEGEGKIADRVENLWKLMLNWIDHIRSADLVVLACHSQGVPVGFMLLAKLIDLGIVTTARIGVCAMAGVSLGPFPEYKSGLGILMGSATELWEFSNPESEVSKRYEAALKTALEYGVRIAYVGSIDDQVVPLESAVNSPVSHPYIYRAVFVDRRIHAPDFIAHLIGFACKLRNLGVSDHGLIRELSIPLAGSLYKGEGHSRIYFEPQVYDLAVTHALETADLGKIPCEFRKHEGLVNPNPYHLPWIMRGLLEEDFVKTDLHVETAELVKQFDDWKPTTKALKDVKYRLEAVRSKL